jgi:hypothetical protein
VKQLLWILLWVLAVAGLYVSLVLLEVYWNLFEWRPKLDIAAFGILVWMGITLTALWFLCWTEKGRVTRIVALVLCTVLVALAIYLVSPEPLKPGLLGRDAISPRWYRTGRFFVLALPGVFLLLSKVARRRSQAGP